VIATHGTSPWSFVTNSVTVNKVVVHDLVYRYGVLLVTTARLSKWLPQFNHLEPLVQ